MIQLFLENPIFGLFALGVIVLSISIHEAAHAYTANYFGDNTPKSQGRLTLNPKSHLDKWGTLMIVLIGIGWGKPVQFNPLNLKDPRRDTALIAFAGPISNIIIATVLAFIVGIFSNGLSVAQLLTGPTLIQGLLIYAITLNVALAVFNMIPIDPLDGFKVIAGILPPHLARQWYETRRYGIFVLLALLITGAVDQLVWPAANFVLGIILQIGTLSFL